MKKPNYHFRRFGTFLLEAQELSLAAVGAVELLRAHAWQRWNPDQQSCPQLPNDKTLLAKLCNKTRNWHRIEKEVMAKFIREDGIIFHPQDLEDAKNLMTHHKRKADKRPTKKEASSTQPKGLTKFDQTVAKTVADAEREDGERKLIQQLNQEPAEPEQERRRWDEPPAPEPGKLVWAVQGHRVIGGDGLDRLLLSKKLTAGKCIVWQVSDAGAKQDAAEVLPDGSRGFLIRFASGQTMKAGQ